MSSFAQTLVRPGRLISLHVYAAALAATTIGFGAVLVGAGASLSGPFWAILLLGAVALCAERQPVRISSNTEITVGFLPLVFAAVVYGPLAAMAVGALGLVADFRRPYVRWVIWTSMRSLSGGVAGAAAWFVIADGRSFGHLVSAVVVAAIAEALMDACLGSLTVALRGTGSCRQFLSGVQPVLFATVPLNAPLIVLLAYAHAEISTWSVLLFFAPTFAAQSLYRLYRKQRDATEKLTEANARLERANLSFAGALVAALDARDQYTAGHSASVAIYAKDIAARLGLPKEQQQLAHLCGLVHDIGKVGLPAGLLEKPGPLTLEERRRMEEHSAIGERILSNVDDYGEIAKIVRHHHERIDGHGYPDGLRGDEIPLLARIIAVADAYDAMTSDRPYRDAMPSQVARMRLAKAVGTEFDTTVAAAFEAILATSTDSYRAGVPADFSVEAQHHPAPEARAVALAG